MPEVDIFVNVQGDEPEISAAAIDQVIELLERNPKADVATLASPIRERERLEDPACVKVVRDHHSNALYFSRQAIPFCRDVPNIDWPSSAEFWAHIGVYAFQRHVLENYSNLPFSPLENSEKLEQLRLLQSGFSIKTIPTHYQPFGIDTESDLILAEQLLLSSQKS